jgi:tetratricopeptide (TPR) repeat protein
MKALFFFFLIMSTTVCGGAALKDIDASIESLTQAVINKDYKEAMELFSALIDLPELTASQRAQIFYLRGWAYQKLSKEYARAIADYSQAIALNEKDKWTFSSFVNRAGCYLDLKEYDKAMDDVEKALTIWPEHPVALNKKQLISDAMKGKQEEGNRK